MSGSARRGTSGPAGGAGSSTASAAGTTPSSVARAEQRADAGYTAALDRARALDNQNNPECAQAVKELKDLLGMP